MQEYIIASVLSTGLFAFAARFPNYARPTFPSEQTDGTVISGS